MIWLIQGSLRLQTRRARRRGAILLIAVWAMFWLSQAYAGCCNPHSGRPHQSMESGAAMHSHALAVQLDCGGGHEPACPVMLDEALPLAGAQLGFLDDGSFTQHLAPSSEPALPSRAARERAANHRLPDSLGPPGRAYLRFHRLLI